MMFWLVVKKLKSRLIKNLMKFYHIKNNKTDIKNIVKT